MARLSAVLNLLVTVLLVAALLGCVTSDSPTTDEAERLDRWLRGGSEESRDAAAAVQRAHEKVVELGLMGPDSIWPGFRPDTIPVLYVVPERGTLLDSE